ncbi:hypothetical protein PCL_05531 [Purpureocillium lilacinum]|uniref:F-box domain-containing protein n=1 Tax=Purpureocillium lilacinum TaxID=33203 RepID=A0A2U3DUX5_PURLI|nr:hypothetical protein PCL_05531 [Purpureocillium lilacinum]
MPGLVSLPVELLQEVLSLLEDDALCALCGTCQTLRAYAEPFLYESITYTFYSNDDKDIPGPPSIDGLFTAIWRRPELAAYVKRAYFVVTGDSLYFDTELRELPPSEEHVDSWVEAILDLDESLQDRISEEVVSGNVGALTAVLLSRLHNLEVLEMDFTVPCSSDAIADVLKASASPSTSGNASGFQQLEELRVINNRDGRVLRYDDSQSIPDALLHLPNLREAEIILQEPVAAPPAEDPILLNNLTRLSILNAGASPKDLASILKFTPQLETLEYFLGQDFEELKNDRRYRCEYRNEWAAFAEAVSTVAGSLKELIISVDWAHIDDYPPEDMDTDWVNGIWERRGRIGSLKSLVCLKRLEVPIVALLGWEPSTAPDRLQDILPMGLRELCLRDDLIDEHHYRWTRWQHFVIGRNLAQSFHDTCNPTDLLERLRRYLDAVGTELESDSARKFGLESLVLKAQLNRVWPDKYLEQLRMMSQAAGVSATVRMRMSGFLTSYDSWNDEVKEMILEAIPGQDMESMEGRIPYDCRYFDEPRRQFRSND